MNANCVSNVIRFPVEKRLQAINAEEDVELEIIENYVDDLTSDVLSSFIESGYPVEGDDYIQDISLVFESIRSLTFKSNSIWHPVQDLADTMYADAVRLITDDRQLSLDFGEEKE